MEYSIPRLTLAGLAVVVLATLLVTGATSTVSFATHNPSWDGTADLRAIAADESSMEIVSNVSAYDSQPANGTIAIVLSPSEPYGKDAAAIRDFLERGGTVLVAEDYRNHANALLASLGASARFDGRPVRDERSYQRAPTLAEITVGGETPLTGKTPLTGETPLTRDIDSLVFNRGTVLEPGNATVLARTTSAAYVDVDGDGTLDETETPSERPVVAIESVGNGRVITLADPSVVINSMLEYGDNREFATRLAEGHDRVVFDVSHTAKIPPLVALVLFVRESLPIQIALGGLLVVGVVNRHRLRSLVDRVRNDRGTASDRPPLDAEEIATVVSRRNPDWDETRIERITEGSVDAEAASVEATREGVPAESSR